MLTTLNLEETTSLLDACPLAVLLLDGTGQVRGCNTAFAALLGESPMDTPETLRELHTNGLLAPLLGEGTLVNWIMPDGDERWLAVETRELAPPGGGTARFFQDISEKLRLKNEHDAISRELRGQSLRDENLTSLFSRRGILVSLEPLVARSRRYNTPLTVIAMGLEPPREHPKQLVRVSYLLRDQTRWADLVGCNPEKDFILVLQETTRDSALQMVEKLTGHLERMSQDQPAPLTARYGVTECRKNDDAKSLLERAESALGEARSNQSGPTIAL